MGAQGPVAGNSLLFAAYVGKICPCSKRLEHSDDLQQRGATMRSIMGLALAIAIGGLATAEDKPADAAKKLEGTYTVVEFLDEGKPSPKTAEIKTVEIKDGVISIKSDEKNEDATFSLDPSKKPMEIDLESKHKGKKILGIYQTKETDKGLELTIAFIHGGDGNGNRPKDFKGEGKEERVMKLLRKK
jgi:uncharacterized protein (TIGR03067 family)